MKDSEKDIARVCDNIKQMLLQKNMHYGDSALEPARIFSKSSVIEQILVRIDDKLNRVKQGSGMFGGGEDVITDLIGYLVLLKIAIDRDHQSAYNEPNEIHDLLH
jgi:hypothetical protein